MNIFKKKKVEKRDRPQTFKAIVKDWAGAMVFALVMAFIINTLFIQLYAVPTPSMEKNIMVGDRLLVSKLNYGPRLPMTPIALPLVHNTLPFTENSPVNSYSKLIELGYLRLPGFESVERGDVVVFNWPESKDADNNYHPVDKKENYVKRCVALPNDVLEIKEGKLCVNSKAAAIMNHDQSSYIVVTDGSAFNNDFLKEIGVRPYTSDQAATNDMLMIQENQYYMFLSKSQAEAVAKNPVVKFMQEDTFPKDKREDDVIQPASATWNRDNFGPLTIPAKGVTVKLNANNLPVYKAIIERYEGNILKTENGFIYINNQKTDSYTFKMDYYFMMGDNRHNSLDSRYWGFVPEDHIVGKPLLVFWSANDRGGLFDGIRWDRLLKKIE